MKKPPKRRNLEIDPKLHSKLRVAAAKSGMSMKQITESLIREFLKGFHAQD
jgi:predicted HicB family RNase H-like nuclease